MTTVTQPLRDEHKELYPHISALREAGDSITENLTPEALRRIDEASEFLVHHLIPHAQAEDAALYPVVQQAMGAQLATATMSRDHVEVGSLTRELITLRGQITPGSITTQQAKALRKVLYGLFALVSVHFAKEEEIYLPLLDAKLTQQEAAEMFEAMESAAHQAKERSVA